MSTPPKKTISIVLTIALFAGALVYFITSGFDDTVVYYKTVDELLAEPTRFETRPVRINGVLVPGSVKVKPGTNDYRFSLTKRGRQLEVAYTGILPDTMQEQMELVVQGVYDTKAGLFMAKEILTKCPSKYESKAKGIR